MLPYLPPLVILTLIAIGTIATGWVQIGAMPLFRVRKGTIESWIIAAFLGTAVWILVPGMASHAGVTSRQSVWLLAAVVISMAIACQIRNPQHFREIFSRRPIGMWPVLGVYALTAFLLLAPVLLHESFNPFNDTFAYVTVSEWLQDHSFSTTFDLSQDYPMGRPTQVYQDGHLRMGATFFLALLNSIFSNYRTIELYPAAVAWFAVLNAMGVYLVCRWAIRLPRSYAVIGAILLVATNGPFYYCAHDGFFPQLSGMAFLLAFTACLSRMNRVGSWSLGSAFLIGIFGATLASVYSEMVPVLGLLCLSFIVFTGMRAYRKSQMPRWGTFVLQCGLLMLAIGNIEWYRAARAIYVQLICVPGGHIPWSQWGFWKFGMGTKDPTLGFVLTVLFLVGCLAICYRKKTFAFHVVLFIFFGMAAYFGGVARDPWSGEIGHTWNILKIACWAIPFVVIAQILGFWMLLRNWKYRVHVERLVIVLLVIGGVVQQTAASRELGVQLRQFVQSDQPFRAIEQIGDRIVEADVDRVYLTSPSSIVWPISYTPYMLPTTAFENGWSNPWVGRPHDLHPSQPSSIETPLLVVGDLSEELQADEVITLTKGWTLIKGPQQPLIVGAENPNYGIQKPDSHFWLGVADTVFVVYSPTAGTTRFMFRGTSGPALPANTTRKIRFAIEGETASEKVIQQDFPDEGQSDFVSVELQLPAGLSTIKMKCLDQPTHPTGDWISEGVPAALLVDISDFAVVPPATTGNSSPAVSVATQATSEKAR